MDLSKIKNCLKHFPNHTQCSIGLIENAQVAFIGVEKVKNKIVEIQNQSFLFEIGSITKVFTTQILAQLVLEGKVKLNDDIYKYLPLDQLKHTKITLLQLANHSSGLPRLPSNFYTVENYDKNDPYLSYDEKALLTYLTYFELESKPGEIAAYSNLGSGLLSYLISIIEKTSFEMVVNQRIFEPLSMTNSSFDPACIKTTKVQGLDEHGNVVSNWNGGILNGCIGIHSTAEDMMKFIHYMLIENATNQLQTKATIQTALDKYIGLGWGIHRLQNGGTIIHHGGGSAGFLAHLKIDRTTPKGIILLSNVSAFSAKVGLLEKLSLELIE